MYAHMYIGRPIFVILKWLSLAMLADGNTNLLIFNPACIITRLPYFTDVYVFCTKPLAVFAQIYILPWKHFFATKMSSFLSSCLSQQSVSGYF
jgi:hypothetical protein